MIFTLVSGMAKFATYEHAGASLSSITEQFPHAIQVIFGLTGFDLSTVVGYFGVMFFYVALMAAIHAVLLGVDIVAKEERDKTTEFLFVKPLARSAILTAKFLAGVTCILIINAVTSIASVMTVNYYSGGSHYVQDVGNLMVGLLFLQILFLSVGVSVAAVSRQPKKSASVATAVLLVTFVLSFLIDFNANLESLRYVTPFRYFDAHLILAQGGLDPLSVGLSSAISVACVAVAYRVYRVRDLTV